VSEIIGPQFYLNANKYSLPLEGFFVETVGQDGPFQLQKAQSQSYVIENAVECAIRGRDPLSKKVGFREYMEMTRLILNHLAVLCYYCHAEHLKAITAILIAMKGSLSIK
jgi:hypothetical protein